MGFIQTADYVQLSNLICFFTQQGSRIDMKDQDSLLVHRRRKELKLINPDLGAPPLHCAVAEELSKVSWSCEAGAVRWRDAVCSVQCAVCSVQCAVCSVSDGGMQSADD